MNKLLLLPLGAIRPEPGHSARDREREQHAGPRDRTRP